jgi:hypothetical protein
MTAAAARRIHGQSFEVVLPVNNLSDNAATHNLAGGLTGFLHSS